MKKCERSSSLITIYSQNVSCDIHSEKLTERLGDEYKFPKRIKHVVKTIAKKSPDVVALNEVRYKEHVDLLKTLLEEQSYTVQSFANNQDRMSFNNILGISKDSEWECVEWKQQWVAMNDEPYLEDHHCLIEGDPYGRGVGIVYLKHRVTSVQVCVLVSHVVPFGEVKVQQQNALLSISNRNMQSSSPIPSVIVGDLNRFYDEKEQFAKQLVKYGILEAAPEKLIIPCENGETAHVGENVGTFTPWPTDVKMYDKLLKEPVCKSPLDVQVYTDSPAAISNEHTLTYASMLKSPNKEPPPEGRNPVRHMLDQRMASDHIAIIGTYRVYSAMQ